LIPVYAFVWLCASTLICLWDAGFVLLRPRTLPGGDLHQFWAPYSIYIEIDKLYGNLTDQFVKWQSVLNLVECVINTITIIALLSSSIRTKHFGTFLAFAVNAFTFWKTVLYFLYDLPHCLPPRDNLEFFLLYILPNGTWLVMPLLCMFGIGKRVSNQLVLVKNPAVK